MKLLKTAVLSVGFLVLGASGAHAFAFTMTSDYDGVSVLAPSDFVVVDVHGDFDAPGVEFLSIAVSVDSAILTYEPGFSSMPTYILYSPPAGAQPAAYMVPNVSPPNIWAGYTPPGQTQINIEYLEPTFGQTSATGSNVWLATLVFHVAGTGDGIGEIALSLSAAGTILAVDGTDVKGDASLSGTPILVTVPEPSVVTLLGLGLSGLGVHAARRRRSDG